MKKCISILFLLTLVTAGVFAQFAVEGGITTDFVNGTLPFIGIRYEFSKFDIMLDANFILRSEREDYNDAPQYSYSFGSHGICINAGVAPKLLLSDSITLSFPVLAQIIFGGRPEDSGFDGTLDPSNYNPGNSTFGIGLLAGARAAYSFNGILFEVIAWDTIKYDAWKGPTASAGIRTNVNNWNTTRFLSNGFFQLGASYKF